MNLFKFIAIHTNNVHTICNFPSNYTVEPFILLFWILFGKICKMHCSSDCEALPTVCSDQLIQSLKGGGGVYWKYNIILVHTYISWAWLAFAINTSLACHCCVVMYTNTKTEYVAPVFFHFSLCCSTPAITYTLFLPTFQQIVNKSDKKHKNLWQYLLNRIKCLHKKFYTITNKTKEKEKETEWHKNPGSSTTQTGFWTHILGPKSRLLFFFLLLFWWVLTKAPHKGFHFFFIFSLLFYTSTYEWLPAFNRAFELK